MAGATIDWIYASIGVSALFVFHFLPLKLQLDWAWFTVSCLVSCKKDH